MPDAGHAQLKYVAAINIEFKDAPIDAMIPALRVLAGF
jgi:hypothetical protein